MGDLRPRLLVLLEGQWDAVTFALAAGLRPGMAVLGMRGAQSAGVALECLRPWLEAQRPAVWMIPDADEAGARWLVSRPPADPDEAPELCFRDALLASGARKVAVTHVRPTEGKDLNDLYRELQFRGEYLEQLAKEAGIYAEFRNGQKEVTA
jgi:hypothetical protein